VVDFRLSVPGDAESRDNVRRRIVSVTAQPAIVVIVDPADVEGRFLLSELAQVAGTAVRGYARVQAGQWVDMLTQRMVEERTVITARRNAALVVVRGRDAISGPTRTPVWHWPAAVGPATEFFEGDWYPTGNLPASPFAGRLAAVQWDSLPPLTGILPMVPEGVQWTALTSRLARRGAERALLLGRDSSRQRRLTLAGAGLWRWVLRGGAAREAYRALLAAGMTRGVPVTFRWLGGNGDARAAPPDSAALRITGPDSTLRMTISFDSEGLALVSLAPGVYSWSFPAVTGARGMTVVEEFSDEYPPRPVTLMASEAGSAFALVLRRARENWWLFVIAVLAFLGEWGWRQRRGLP
jgi:hypothetical protein